MNVFDVDIRRQHSRWLTSLAEELMLRVANNNRSIAGWSAFILHTFIVVIVYYLLLWTNSKLGFLIGLLLWLSFVLQHLYFDGCWGVKSERRIWQVKDWYGPWTALFNFLHKIGMPATKPYHNVFFILFTIMLSVLAIERYISFYR